MDLKITECANSYEQNGFGVIEGFLSQAEIDCLKAECVKVLENSDDDQVHLFNAAAMSDYFVNSGDKVCAFREESAFDKNGKLIVDKLVSYAKIGHALHSLNYTFKRVTFDAKIKAVFKAIGFEDPVVVQSMVIFKNPKVGGEYPAHQDSSFLITEPEVALAGAWIALDDATNENGCLEFIPGSQSIPVNRKFVRNQNRKSSTDLLMAFEGPNIVYDENMFVQVPVKKGGLVILDGAVVHRSLENKSDKPRWIYTFHVIDAAKAKWSERNWLQQVQNKTFIPLFATSCCDSELASVVEKKPLDVSLDRA